MKGLGSKAFSSQILSSPLQLLGGYGKGDEPH